MKSILKPIAFATLLLSSLTLSAKDIRTAILTTNPKMSCSSCELKIRNYIRFEKGIRKVEPKAELQQVYIEYDADKISLEGIQKGFAKIGYTTELVPDSLVKVAPKSKKSK